LRSEEYFDLTSSAVTGDEWRNGQGLREGKGFEKVLEIRKSGENSTL
jgi:hypothetical protein